TGASSRVTIAYSGGGMEMPPEEQDATREVEERPIETRGESAEADAARSSQEKPQDLKEKEQQHSEWRLRGMTASSTDLPKIDLLFEDGGLVVKVGERSVNVGAPEDHPELIRSLAPGPQPAETPPAGGDYGGHPGPAGQGGDYGGNPGPATGG